MLETKDVAFDILDTKSSNVTKDIYKLNMQVFLLNNCPYWSKDVVVACSGECALAEKNPDITTGTDWKFAGRAVLMAGFLVKRAHYLAECVMRKHKSKVRKANV